MIPSPLTRAGLAAAALAALVALAGCDTDGLSSSARSMKPLSPAMLAEIEQKNMTKESPILVRLFKQEAELEVWKEDRSGRFSLLKTYPICRWSGDLGPKIREGDRQAPEGFYAITPGQMNPHSSYYLAFNLGYPNAYDRAWGRTGAELMVHGDCSSRGCYAMTDEQISEIYALARESFFGGQRSFQVQAYPFRMTPANMARHRSNPNMAFWKMLKRGYDTFEVTHLEPKVDVCEKRYVFDAEPPAGSTRPLNFSAAGRCPAYQIPQDIADAVEEKQRRDEFQTAELIRHGTPTAPVRSGVDGGMNPVFANAMRDGGAVSALAAMSLPGTIPASTTTPEERQRQLVAAGKAPVAPVATASADSVPVPRAAPNRGDEPGSNRAYSLASAEPPRSSSLFGGLMGRLIGSDSAQAATPPASEPAPIPAARPAHTASIGAIRPAAHPPLPRPEPKQAQPAQAAPSQAPAQAPARIASPWPEPAKPQTSPWPAPARPANAGAIAAPAKPHPVDQDAADQTKTASTQSSNGSLVSGSAPVMPTGSFSNRWGSLR